ncbi:MAG: ribonuclease J [Actinomycetota bacterium]|nr:ribonuclease J [Actinomycetota bacterium]MCL6093713.1 ribonuclease J [Actinomycetota bacterium]MDA8167893.1 ribonuclease J [Actinomycetota bacterium]
MTESRLRIIPLGGLGEIGKNMMVLDLDGRLLVIDAGLSFPRDELLGIDLIIPDFTFLRERASAVEAVLLTHGHEDHVGALPFLLREINVPVYGTRLTLGLVRNKLEEHGLAGKVELREITTDRPEDIGPFHCDFISVTHSIPDGVAVAVTTPVGTIVHSGDFKLDPNPIDHRRTNLGKFGELGSEGVMLLLSDSTNAEVEGVTGPEKSVGKTIDEIFSLAKGRIIVSSFASHIHRIQQVVNAARRHRRRLAVVGRSMVRNVQIARELGYLDVPEEMMISLGEIGNFKPRKVVILSSGSQGEPLSALTRMAFNDHKKVKLQEDDTVIMSARPVPGNELSVHQVINRLFKAGAEVVYESVAPVHVSGHAAREELKMLINLTQPKYFMPIHGEYRHLHFHKQLAEEMGMSPKRIIMAANGDVVELSGGKVRIVDSIEAGATFVDGLDVGDIQDVTLRDRKKLSRDGSIIVVLPVRQQDGSPAAPAEISDKGFVYMRNRKEFMNEVSALVKQIIKEGAKLGISDPGLLQEHIHDRLARFIYKKTKKRPLIIAVVVEV